MLCDWTGSWTRRTRMLGRLHMIQFITFSTSAISLFQLLALALSSSRIRIGSRSSSTTAGPAALSPTWSWGTSIYFKCSAKTSAASASRPASAGTQPSWAKQVTPPPHTQPCTTMICKGDNAEKGEGIVTKLQARIWVKHKLIWFITNSNNFRTVFLAVINYLDVI